MSYITLKYFFFALFNYYFGIKKNLQLYYAGKCLIEKPSFRIPDGANEDLLFIFRTLKRTVFLIWNNKEDIKKLSMTSVAILDASYQFIDFEPKYIEKLSQKKTGYFIAKNKLLFGNSFGHKCFCAFYALFIFSVLLPVFFLSKHRANIALLVSEISECAALLFLIKKYHINEIHDFIPFEKDSNICALILMKNNVYVNKLPSTGPLMGHNKIIISTQLTTSSHYHVDEYNFLKNTMFVGNIIEWIPEYSLSYIDKYFNKNLATSPNTIGFYSSASWLRKRNKHHHAVVPGSMEEELLIELLKEYLLLRKNLKLSIFLHPKEKEILIESTAHYNSIFGEKNYQISNPDLKSSLAFENVDVGVSAYSTVLFERLFCGFKTVFFPYAVNDFPVPGSSLNNICLKEKSALFQKLDESFLCSTPEFFEKNNIKEYIFSGWKK